MAGAEVMNGDNSGFRYPSYVEDIMGDIFSLGFGPFRCMYKARSFIGLNWQYLVHVVLF